MKVKTEAAEPYSQNETMCACLHCGSPIPPERFADEFCCAGCCSVHALIHAKGLDSYYAIRKSEDAKLQPIDSKRLHRDWSILDHSETAGRFTVDGKTMKFHVDDLTCGACVWILERLEQASAAVVWSRLDLSRSTLTVHKKDGARFSEIAGTISQLGFQVDPLGATSAWLDAKRRTEKRDLVRTGILGALTGNIMLLSIPLYGGATGVEALLFRSSMAALTLPVVTWGAWPLYRNTWRAFRQKRLSLDLPISLAVIAGAIIGMIGLIRSLDTLFFDSVAMLVFLLQASRTSLSFLRGRFEAVDEIPRWFLQPVHKSGGGPAIAPEMLRKGDAFTLSANQFLPVDAAIHSPSSTWDLSVLTGESQPILPQYGTILPAGARLLSETAELQSYGSIQESRIAKLLSDWRESPRERRSFSQAADRVGQVFTIIVLTTAGGLLFTDMQGQPGWLRALSLLVVTCPCIFGVAIPLAENLAMNRASESGLLVREPSFFERLLHVRKVFFDKTGTLTTGRMNLEETLICDFSDGVTEEEALALASAIERDDLHPVARALVDRAKERGISPSPKIFHSTVFPGGGRGAIGRDGYYTLRSVPSDNAFINIELTRNARRLALFLMKDEIKPFARETVQDLTRQGIEIEVLSGDHAPSIARVLQDLEVESGSSLKSRVTPEGKASFVRTANAEQPVMMIGDGANDAEALKAASVSIAIKGDFAACLEAADAVLLATTLQPVQTAYTIARRLRTTLRTCLLFSSAFNLIAGTLAVLGHMSPLIAAILMPTSSLIVTTVTWLSLGAE